MQMMRRDFGRKSEKFNEKGENDGILRGKLKKSDGVN